MDDKEFEIVDGVLVKYKGKGGDVIIPSGVTGIGYMAFNNCSSLKSITIPSSVASIGVDAFYSCCNLTSVTIPDSITSIGDCAFQGCSSLTSITIPESVTSIGYGAFEGCSNLTSITIPDGVTSIGNWAFQGCSSLTSITIPASVNRVNEGAFSHCKNLTDIVVLNQKLKYYIGAHDYIESSLYPCLYTLLPHLTDSDIKKHVLQNDVWNIWSPEQCASVYLTRQTKYLIPWYSTAIRRNNSDSIARAIIDRITDASSAKECSAAGNYLLQFQNILEFDTKSALYQAIKNAKNGAKAIEEIEKDKLLMQCLSGQNEENALTELDKKLGRLAEMIGLNSFVVNARMNDVFALEIKNLPDTLFLTDGNQASAEILAIILMVENENTKPGILIETAALLEELDAASLQETLLRLADDNLGGVGSSKKMYLANPICHLADEETMRELTRRAPKWASTVSGNNAPPLLSFRDANLFSNTRSAMLLAERYHELDRYAELRGMTEDDIRDRYLSETGLDANGGMIYDLGNQCVTVRLQKDLSFIVEIENGKTAKSLPKKGADPEKYEEANTAFTALKKDVKRIAKNSANRLFEDFLSGRARKATEWKQVYLQNPVLRHIAELLVWEQEGKTFTLANGGAVTAEGNAFSISDRNIRLVHPMDMKNDAVKSWQDYFRTRQLKQPFVQMWEPVLGPDMILPERYKGVNMSLFELMGKDKHGIHTFGIYAYSEGFGFTLQDCELTYSIDTYRLDYSLSGEVILGTFKFKAYTRYVNHIAYILDKITVEQRLKKNDITAVSMLDSFTAAQVTEFVAQAADRGFAELSAALLEYKQTHFPEYDAFTEFTLDLL